MSAAELAGKDGAFALRAMLCIDEIRGRHEPPPAPPSASSSISYMRVVRVEMRKAHRWQPSSPPPVQPCPATALPGGRTARPLFLSAGSWPRQLPATGPAVADAIANRRRPSLTLASAWPLRLPAACCLPIRPAA